MKLEEIKNLCEKGEKKVVEYKTSTSTLRSAFETVCAFLNSKGGIVLLGVKDDGSIVGQHVSDGTRKDIATEISKIEPTPSIDVDYIDIGSNKYVIAIQVETGEHLPYIYDGRAFQRDESKTNRMSQHRYEQLIIQRGQLNHSWEAFPAMAYEINDLDRDEIYRAVEQGIIANRVPASVRSSKIEDILANWNLIQEEDGKLKNAAAILFAKKVLPHYLQCHIKLGRFRGIDKLNDFIDNKDFFGNAFQILEEANQFLMRHLPIASFFEPDHFERIDKPTLPVLAVREALVNAICHRDYSDRTSSITLAIFDDRMEIWNNGNLPSNFSIEELKQKHQSKPRNKLTSKVFYDRKYFDGWGGGISKIFDLCRKHGVPEPEYQTYSGGVEIIFRFKEPIGFQKQAQALEILKYQLSTRHKTILKVLATDLKMTVSQIANSLDQAPSKRTIGDDLAYLKRLNLVHLEGTGRGAKWSLTKIGQEWGGNGAGMGREWGRNGAKKE